MAGIPGNSATSDHLYAGADLRVAADRSVINDPSSGRVAGLRNAAALLVDIVRYRDRVGSDESFDVSVVSGTAPGSETEIVAAYVGNGGSREWCLSTAIEGARHHQTCRVKGKKELAGTLKDIASNVNILFTEGVADTDGYPLLRHSLTIPAWIRQRVRICDAWHTQVEQFKRGTRQEISRVLRRHGYSCRLTHDRAEIDSFYHDIYHPYIQHRHGDAAILVDSERLWRECRRGVLMQVLCGESLVAAAVLRRVGATMAVVWTGNRHEKALDGLRGSTDILDYFSLLYAHLKGCRWLDLGRSRPDLHDGLFRYKRKWGAEPTAGFVPQAMLRLACAGNGAQEADYLVRHAFVSQTGRKFRVSIFADAGTDPGVLLETIDRLVTPGISEYRVIAISPHDRLTDLPDRCAYPVTTIRVDSVQDAIRAARR